jgi:hypothetical protein
MEPLIKSSIPVANGAIQTYQRGGISLNTEGVEEYLLFEAIALDANEPRAFRLPNSYLRLLSLWAFNGSGNITLSIRFGATTLTSLSINNATATGGFAFPLLILTPEQDFAVSSNQPIGYLKVFAKQVYLTDIISPYV